VSVAVLWRAMRTLMLRSHCCTNCLKIPTVIVIGRQLRVSFQKQRAPRTASPNIRTYIRRAVLLKDERDGNGSLPSLFWLSHVWKTNLTGWSVYRIVPCDKSCFLTNAILRERKIIRIFSVAPRFFLLTQKCLTLHRTRLSKRHRILAGGCFFGNKFLPSLIVTSYYL